VNWPLASYAAAALAVPTAVGAITGEWAWAFGMAGLVYVGLPALAWALIASRGPGR
jgi:hypothetical protein